MSLDYWYDGQLRRYWMQFCRIFEGFQYESGVGANGTKTLRTFPVSLAGKNRQVGHILRNGSENTMLSTPRITCEMLDIQQSPDRRQTPNHVSTVNIFERAIDPATNRYTGELGKTYTVERFMAIPYDITMRVNIWTSNEQQKHQFMEQVLVLFNPSIDIQTGDNPIDWTSLTIVELESVTWSNRELPIGSDDDIEIATLTFKMPIWLTPPAKIKRQNIIHQIITNIGEMNNNYVGDQAGGYNFSSNDLHTRVIVTPGNHQVRVEVVTEDELINGEWKKIKKFVATLLSEEGHEEDPEGKPYDWRTLLTRYGQYRQGVSQFRLKVTDNLDDHDSDIVGIFDFHNTKPNVLYWSPSHETMPRPTLQSINAMIDLSPVTPPFFKTKQEEEDFVPRRTSRWPGDGVLPEAAEGDRYLLASDLYYDYTGQGEPYPIGWDFGIPEPDMLQFRQNTTDPKSGEVLEQHLYFVDDHTKHEVTYADLPGLYEVGKFIIRGTELVERTLGNKWLARSILETRILILDRATGNFKTTTYPSEIILARANDIIEYKDGKWQVVFDSNEEDDEEIVLNMASGKHLRWTSGMWVDAVSGDYNPGYWRVFL